MKIGLIPMAAKPYHAGHHALVTAAAGENDEVILYISLSDRKRKGEVPIYGADMQTVWKEEIEKILPVGWAHGDRYSDLQWIGPEKYC